MLCKTSWIPAPLTKIENHFVKICTILFCFIVACLLVPVIYISFFKKPLDPKIYITNASLTQFNFNTTTNNANTLHYNLALNVTIQNPNKKGIHYRDIQVIASYISGRFATVTLSNSTTPFYQGHKNTTFLNHVLLQGQQVVKFEKDEISQLNKETAAGVYSIDVSLLAAAQHYKLMRFDCELKVPLTSSSSSLNETSAGTLSGFKTTKCGSSKTKKTTKRGFVSRKKKTTKPFS